MKTLNPFQLLQINFDKVLKLCQSLVSKQVKLLAIFILLLAGTTTTAKAQTQITAVEVGDTVELQVTGHNGTIQWQQSTDSLAWSNMTGLTDSIETFTATSSITGKKYYRAIITDALCPNATPVYSSIIRHKLITSTTEVQVGDWFNGGIVFYTDGTGHGLIAPLQDQSTGVEWGCYGTSIPGATSTTDGAANTTAIVAACSTRPIAASVCDTLTLNGYSDWFLPAKEQLNYLYLQRSLVGGFSDYSYWSSSENGAYDAWEQNFGDGYQDDAGKYNGNGVRCVRSF